MKKKQDIDNFFRKYGLILLEPYKRAEDKHFCEDNEHYKYYISVDSLRCRKNLNMSSGRYNNKNIFKEYNIYHFMDINVNNKTSVVKIPLNIDNEEIIFKCGICGKEFNQLWKVFINNNPYKCCQNCVSKLKKSKLKSPEYIKEIYMNNGYEPLEICNKGMHHAYYVMDKWGYKGLLQPYSATKKKYGVEKFHSWNKYTFYNINLFFLKNNIPLKCSEHNETYGDDQNINFICSCGEEFSTTLRSVIEGKWQCNVCSKYMSNNEYAIYCWLKNRNIEFISQYKINNYRGYKRLFFDFFLPKYNIFIEVDGEQHEKPTTFGGCSIEIAEQNLKFQIDRNVAKNIYCEENGISLYRINYRDIKNNNYKDILNSIIRED